MPQEGPLSIDVDRKLAPRFETSYWAIDNEISFEAEVIARGTPTGHSQHEKVELAGEVYHQASGGGGTSIAWLDPLIAARFRSPMRNNMLHVAALRSSNNNMVMDELVDKVAKEDLDRLLFGTNMAGETPLHVAAREGNIPTLEKMLAYACADNNVGRLLSSLAKQNPRRGGNSVLHEAIMSSGDRNMMLSMIFQVIEACAAFDNNNYSGKSITVNNLKKAMFQLFIFCITISLFTSTSATLLLIWGKLGLIQLLNLSITLAKPLLGVALLTLSLTFLAGVYTVISKLTWLAITFVVITSILVAMLFVMYILLYLPLESANKAARYLSHYPFIFLAWLAGE